MYSKLDGGWLLPFYKCICHFLSFLLFLLPISSPFPQRYLHKLIIQHSTKMLQLEKLTELGEQIEVVFCYDYLPNLPSFITPKDWILDIPVSNSDYVSNSILLRPRAANLPFHTSFAIARENRFAEEAVTYTAEIYKLFTEDQGFQNVPLINGSTMADLALKQLDKPPKERMIASALALFPFANEKRVQLIAASILFVVFFDGTT